VAPTDPLIDATVADRYHVRSFAHDEALGRVYVAFDEQEQQLVHLKVLAHEFANDSRKFERFGREITATFMVTHPNTVEVLDFGEDDGRLYLVLEFLACHELSRDLLRGPMDPLVVASVGAQVAAAIGAAHQEGIVHRNLCPDNVLLLDNAKEGVAVKVRDFGLSKLESAEATEGGLTTANTRLGVAAYTAPEYMQTGNFHLKGDLYALGAILWHMLVGRPPYEGAIDEVLNAAMAGPPDAPSVHRDDVPDWLDAIVVDLLARDPADRPGAYKLVQRLEAGAGDPLKMPPLLPLDEHGQPIPEPEPEEAGNGRGMALLAVVAVGVAFVVVLGLVITAVALSILLFQLAT
jgi:serine/threonine-protein kinase